jgi:uncharacterized repeat protein (TIGR04138 family)
MTEGWKAAYAAMHRDGGAEFPPAAMRYVLEIARGESRKAQAPLSPADLVAAFRRAARADFGPLLPEVLEHWDLRAPASLGRAVEALGRYGCLSLDEADTVAAFASDTLPLAEVAP